MAPKTLDTVYPSSFISPPLLTLQLYHRLCAVVGTYLSLCIQKLIRVATSTREHSQIALTSLGKEGCWLHQRIYFPHRVGLSLFVGVPDGMGILQLGFLVLGTERAEVRPYDCGTELKSTLRAQTRGPVQELSIFPRKHLC